MNNKLKYEPKSSLIEKTAAALATEWFEIGMQQGLKSKYKNHQQFARANLEKFIPKAIEHLIQILGNPTFPELAKAEIYDALMDRHNNPAFFTGGEMLPDIDAARLTNLLELYEKDRITIKTDTGPKTVLHNLVTKRAQ